MSGSARWILGCWALATCQAPPFPVIGIMSHPCWGDIPLPAGAPRACQRRCEYLPASYVKFVELAGARAVPISFYASDDEIDDLLVQLNGVLLMGGAPRLPPSARRLVARVLEINDAGGHFPLWGTCLGFEWISDVVTGEDVIVPGFDADNVSMRLQFRAEANASRLFGDPSFRESMAANALAFNSHHLGLEVATFEANAKLRERFRLLATNVDRQGRAFVSAMEAFDAPIYGVQYHPEKNIFEWTFDDDGTPHFAIPHTRLAVHTSQQHADLFVAEARKNTNVYDLRREDKFFESMPTFLTYQPTFVQVYFPCVAEQRLAGVGRSWATVLIGASLFLVAVGVVVWWRRLKRERKTRHDLPLGTSLQGSQRCGREGAAARDAEVQG